MRVILFVLAVFLFAMMDFSFAYTINPINITNPSAVNRVAANNPINATMNLQNLSQIEKNLFGKIYSKQSLQDRLSRVERRIFTTTYTNLSENQRLDNIVSNYNKINVNPNISSNSLTRLEKRILNQNFDSYSAQNRIERLEQELFGAIQSGNLAARVKALEIASKNRNNNADFGTESFGNGFLGALFSRGCVTGITPPINTFEPVYNKAMYGPMHNYNRWNHRQNFHPEHGYYKGVRTPFGYRNTFRNYGGGTSVTILD